MKRYLTFLAILLCNFPSYAWIGDGTEISPYQIWDMDDLQLLADTVNTTSKYYLAFQTGNLHFKLMADIVTPLNFRIGHNNPNISHRFNNVFDGNGYKITVSINSNPQYSALFGYIENYGVVKNLTVDGNIISSTGKVGGIAGDNYGIIQNCTNYASIHSPLISNTGGIVGMNSSVVQNCINYGEIIGNLYVGGIAGINSKTIVGCINAATIVGTGGVTSNVGGIAGRLSKNLDSSYSYIENCINIGIIVGENIAAGIIGYIYVMAEEHINIYNCINAGFIKGIDVAGIIGVLYHTPDYLFFNLSDCINTGVIEGTGSAGAIVGKMLGGLTITNCHYDKQFCIHKGVNGQDVPGVYGHITRNMVGRKLASLLGDNDWTYVEGATLI